MNGEPPAYSVGRLARSTPELIVEKLAGEDVAETDFYEDLLEKF